MHRLKFTLDDFREYADEIPHMKLFVILIQLLILITNIPMLVSTLKYSLTMLDSLLVVSCVNRYGCTLLSRGRRSSEAGVLKKLSSAGLAKLSYS
jgi:hypothetical protein